MKTLLLAESIARQAHDGQYCLTGAPYITHVERVVAGVEHIDAKSVAWLHDVIEDTDITADDLRQSGIPDVIVAAVELLTRPGDQSPIVLTYAEYIDRLIASRNPLALAVKLSDLYDHLCQNCPERLRPRYEAALIAFRESALR